MFGILQPDLPDVERGKPLFIDEGAHSIRRNRRPLRFAHGSGHWARGKTTRRTYPPQPGGCAVIRRKNDLVSVGCPSVRSHDRTIIESEASRRATPYRHDKDVIADARNRSTDEREFFSVGRKHRVTINRAGRW